MNTRHLAPAAVGLVLLLGACGSGSSGSKDSSAHPVTTAAPVATTVAPAGPTPTVRTDDLDAELSGIDKEVDGAQQSVSQSDDTSPDRADD
jgi:hypothetical protein